MGYWQYGHSSWAYILCWPPRLSASRRNTGEAHLDSVNLDHRHLRAGVAARPAMISLPDTTAAIPDTKKPRLRKTTMSTSFHSAAVTGLTMRSCMKLFRGWRNLQCSEVSWRP
jgi:hypothetical protein